MPALFPITPQKPTRITKGDTNHLEIFSLPRTRSDDQSSIVFRQWSSTPVWTSTPVASSSSFANVRRELPTEVAGGAIVGVLVGTTIIVLLLKFCCYQSRSSGSSQGKGTSHSDPPSPPPIFVPPPARPPPLHSDKRLSHDRRSPRGNLSPITPSPLDSPPPPGPPLGPQPSKRPPSRVVKTGGVYAKRRRRRLDLSRPSDTKHLGPHEMPQGQYLNSFGPHCAATNAESVRLQQHWQRRTHVVEPGPSRQGNGCAEEIVVVEKPPTVGQH
jgi:hypothetical protein